MTRRAIIVLAAVLAALVVVILASQRGEQRPAAELGLLLPGLSDRLDDITSVRISVGGGEVVATLRRAESGWVVAERNDYPADVTKLRGALLALAEARRIEQKTANPQLYERLGVEPIEDASAKGTLVSISGSAEPVDLVVGDAAGSDYRYVRLKEDAASWLIDRDPNLPRSTGKWLAADILDVDGDRVQSVSVAHPDGEIVQVNKARRDQADFSVQNVPRERELLYDGVANVMGEVLEKLQLEDVEQALPGTDPAAIVTEFRTFDGLVLTVTCVDREDSAWVSFVASVDAEQAAAFAQDTQESKDDTETAAVESAEAAVSEIAAPATSGPDVAQEAAALNEQLTGWRYKITRFKFDQMTRDMGDLLQVPPAEDS